MMRSTLLAALVSAAIPMTALAQTADELKNDDKTPGDVLTYGMGYTASARSLRSIVRPSSDWCRRGPTVWPTIAASRARPW